MRRAIDLAKHEIEQLRDRDAILDRFFVHASELFKFTVLFIVRGDVACGRSSDGLGAPVGLVSRLVIPLNEQGILSQAMHSGKPYVASTSQSSADSMLVGTLGRALPSALVAPIRVRDRAVAIVVGEGPSDTLVGRATAIGRAPLDLAREELILLATTVGDVFERLIVRKKGGSMPPPAFLQPELGGPFPGAPRLPGAFAASPPSHEPPAPPVAPAPARSRGVLYGVLGAVGIGGLVASYVILRPEPGPQSIVTKAEALPGYPKVDPTALVEAAKAAAKLGPSAELLAIQAEGVVDGKVALNDTGVPAPIVFAFATADTEAEVRVDHVGVHGPHKEARARCGGEPCRASVASPKCTSAQLWEAAKSVGLGPNDKAQVNYSSSRQRTTEAEPEWFVKIAGRGTVRFTSDCKPLPRQRFIPNAVPLEALPDAPRVDPLKVLPLAREHAGLESDAVILEIEAKGLGTDGRVSLVGGDRGIIYTFADPDSVPAAQRRWRQVNVGAQGMPMVAPESDREPMPLRFKGAVLAPRCTFERIWKILGQVPKDVTARVTYGRDSSGTASEMWTIEVPTMGARQSTSDRVCAAY
jgi:hypothetical protein